ncbi:hypothetical protein [Calycomorphotria hydatis]|uniref:Integrase n=1 Tax=Calycomorphotria hydatis TaxID=2528027 RepID=A0A517T937_9PLAN|nr:hypothetical protein [Calycomorphotria hydatis]QDT64904.1 hypothetical protein V22_21470 [Calycomorphotria hydatis]
MTVGRRIPKYRHYKPKNLGVVRIEGNEHYLGKYDSAASWEKYHRLIAEWISRDGTPETNSRPTDERRQLSISQVMLKYLTFARNYYVRD